jgi:hypothetical protein
MATTTTNYGFDIPQSTDLVKDGATAIATLGQDIDTAMNTALGTKKAGMVLLNTTSFSGVASQSVNDVFSATYDNYFIQIDFTHGSTQDASIKLRKAGVDKSTNYVMTGSFLNGASVGSYGTGTTTFFYTMQVVDTRIGLTNLFIARPAISGTTTMFADSVGGSAAVRYATSAYQTDTETYDGFTFICGTSMSGKIKVFGVNQ